jgi:hypothetical protein
MFISRYRTSAFRHLQLHHMWHVLRWPKERRQSHGLAGGETKMVSLLYYG